MSAALKLPFKGSKIKDFLLFLFLATIFWVLTKFSKQDVESVTATITYVNMPEGTILAPDSNKEITFTLAANRFEFLRYVFKKPFITINVGSNIVGDEDQVTINEAEIERMIRTQIVNDGVITKISNSEITFRLEQLNFKRIAITPNADVQYKIGFDALQPILVIPDSITITGPKDILDTITSVATNRLALENISASFNKNVLLKIPNTDKVTFSQKEVVLQQDVAEFSQKTISVPITFINQPSNGSFKLLPANVAVTFNVPIQKFNEVSVKDFTIVCDFLNRNMEENFMIPIIQKSPEYCTGIELETKKIDILLFK